MELHKVLVLFLASAAAAEKLSPPYVFVGMQTKSIPRMKSMLSGGLLARQYECNAGLALCYYGYCCLPGISCCPDGCTGYAPQVGECCSNGGYCPESQVCCEDSCIPDGTQCCRDGGYCEAGYECVLKDDGNIDCCPDGICYVYGETTVAETLTPPPTPVVSQQPQSTSQAQQTSSYAPPPTIGKPPPVANSTTSTASATTGEGSVGFTGASPSSPTAASVTGPSVASGNSIPTTISGGGGLSEGSSAGGISRRLIACMLGATAVFSWLPW